MTASNKNHFVVDVSCTVAGNLQARPHGRGLPHSDVAGGRRELISNTLDFPPCRQLVLQRFIDRPRPVCKVDSLRQDAGSYATIGKSMP